MNNLKQAKIDNKFNQAILLTICLFLSTNLYAECKISECSDNTNQVYLGSSVQLAETVSQTVIDRCITSNRKPLRLTQSHFMYDQIHQLKPNAAANKDRLQVVLNENADPCEITTVVLMP